MVTILELLYHGLDTGLTVRQQDAMVAPNDQMFFSVQLNLNRRSLFSRCLKQSQPSKSKCLGLLEHKTEQRRYTPPLRQQLIVLKSSMCIWLLFQYNLSPISYALHKQSFDDKRQSFDSKSPPGAPTRMPKSCLLSSMYAIL
jgi:hypothetical protein